MLVQVMTECRNFFHIHDRHRQVVADIGEFSIENGIIKPVEQKYHLGQYVRILGSVFNTGVFQIERVGDGYIDIALHSEDYPLWVAPSGTVGLYSIGDRVTHNGIRYISLVDNNSWEPGTDERLWEPVDVAEHSLMDEVFTGAICPLAVPREFVALAHEIEAWNQRAQSNPNRGVITSESNQVGSIHYATGNNGTTASWAEVFVQELHGFRKLRDEVIL